MAQRSDDRLVEQSLAGHSTAFAELVRRYEQPLAALIRREVSDRHHRQDVFQATLLQAWASLAQLRDRSKVKAWLIAIARNRCRDFRKSAQRKDKPTDKETMQAYVSRMGRTVKSGEEVEELGKAMRKITSAQREVVQLFYIEGLTIAEIGLRTQKPQGTVKSRLFHARKALRRSFGLSRPERETPP